MWTTHFIVVSRVKIPIMAYAFLKGLLQNQDFFFAPK